MNGVSFFFFELTRYTATGLSTQDITAFYTPLCRLPVSLLLRAVWSTDGRALYALERAQPSVIGEIDSTFCTYDLISSGQENADYGLAAALAPQSDEVEGIPSVEPPPELTQKNLPQQAESPSVRQYRGAEENLRFYSIDSEQFSVDTLPDGTRTVVNADDKQMVRRMYDNSLRLVKRESWKIGTSLSDSALVATQLFTYDGENPRPSFSSIEKDTSYTEFQYDEKGRTRRCMVYRFPEEKKDAPQKKKEQKRKIRIADSITTWKYTDSGKIAEVTYIKYDAEGILRILDRKETYRYPIDRDDKRPPDYKYYENGQLRMKTNYTDPDTYETTVYFESGYTIITSFEHGRRKTETIVQNGKTVRKHTYE